MQTLTENQYEILKSEIYQTLMGVKTYTSEGEEIEMGLGEMGDCEDAAHQIIKDWTAKANIQIEDEPTKHELYLSIPVYNGAVRVWEDEETITEELQEGLKHKTFPNKEAKQEYLNGLFDASDDGGDNYTILTKEQYEEIQNWMEEETPNHLQNDKTN